MINYKDFGMRVRTLRRKQSMTQEDLAEKAGLSPSFIGHIERGTRIASLETLVELCNALQTSPQYLLEASLDDELTYNIPEKFTPEERGKLSAFLRMADDVLENWGGEGCEAGRR